MKKLLLFALLLFPTAASAQCNGSFPAGNICGSVSGGAPGPAPATSFAVGGNQGGSRADFNSSNWTFTTPSPTNTYVLMPFSNTEYNLGSVYTVYPGSYSTANPPTNTFFKPPANTHIVCFGAQVFIQAGVSLGSSHNGIIKIIKDFVVNSSGAFVSGADVGEGALFGYYGNTTLAAGVLSVCDHPVNNNEYYGLFIFIDGASGSSGGDSITVSGNDAHTAFSMSVLY